jgi:hypothetical protein
LAIGDLFAPARRGVEDDYFAVVFYEQVAKKDSPRRSFNEHPLPFAVYNERLLLQRWVSQGTLPQFAALSVFLLSPTIISIICTLACAIAG